MTTGARIQSYLARLGANSTLREQLVRAAPEDFAALQSQLAQRNTPLPADAATLAASEARLRAYMGTSRKGDAALAQLIRTGADDSVQLLTTPPLQRATMLAEPWDHNPFKRLWRAMRERLFGHRVQMRSQSEPAVRPRTPSAWRRTGRYRRLLLLGLVLAQTYAATYLMIAVLPYQGRHLLEIAILVIYAVLFAWISAGFWTALLGFGLLLFRRDRHAISATVAGDPDIDASARTAVLVPICNEDEVRIFKVTDTPVLCLLHILPVAHFNDSNRLCQAILTHAIKVLQNR